jgi:hypothetical protein
VLPFTLERIFGKIGLRFCFGGFALLNLFFFEVFC